MLTYILVLGDINRGCSAFRAISQNVEKEESSIKEDTGMHDVQYTEVWRYYDVISSFDSSFLFNLLPLVIVNGMFNVK